jgi:arylformamidase
MPVHSTFLGAGPDQVAIEEVDLLNVEPGDYQLIALPLKLTGLEAAPARGLLGYE